MRDGYTLGLCNLITPYLKFARHCDKAHAHFPRACTIAMGVYCDSKSRWSYSQILSLREELQSSHREREVLMSQLHVQLSDREEQLVEARAGQAAAEVEARDKANDVARQAVSGL